MKKHLLWLVLLLNNFLLSAQTNSPLQVYGQPLSPIAVIGVMIAIVFAMVGIRSVIKGIKPFIKKIKFKIAGQEAEIELNNDDKKLPTSSTYQEKSIALIMRIMSVASDHIYRKSKLRTKLFDAQMKRVRETIASIERSIELVYAIGTNHTVSGSYVRMMLDYIFENKIMNNMSDLFSEDKLTEQTKDSFIDSQRQFIDDLPSIITTSANEIALLIQEDEEKNIIQTKNKLMIETISKHIEELKKKLYNCLEKCYELAIHYNEELTKADKENNIVLNTLVNDYLGLVGESKVEKSWDDSVPPVDIVPTQKWN